MGGLALLLIYPFLFLKPELLSVVCSQRALTYIHIYTHTPDSLQQNCCEDGWLVKLRADEEIN